MTCTNNITGRVSLSTNNTAEHPLADFEIHFAVKQQLPFISAQNQLIKAKNNNHLTLTTKQPKCMFSPFFPCVCIVVFFFPLLLRATSRLYSFSQAFIVRLSKAGAVIGIKIVKLHLLDLLFPLFAVFSLASPYFLLYEGVASIHLPPVPVCL